MHMAPFLSSHSSKMEAQTQFKSKVIECGVSNELSGIEEKKS